MYPEVFKAKNFFKTNDFQNKLYDCVIANYFDLNNPIRFNNFAYSIRELLREKFDYEAPDEQIKLCTWYSPLLENNEEKNKPTRSDKVRYYLAAGLNDSQLQLLQVENDIKSIQNKYLKTVNTLSKYTHINEKNKAKISITQYQSLICPPKKTYPAIISCGFRKNENYILL